MRFVAGRGAAAELLLAGRRGRAAGRECHGEEDCGTVAESHLEDVAGRVAAAKSHREDIAGQEHRGRATAGNRRKA